MTSKRLVAGANMKVPTPGAQKYLQVYIPIAWCMFAIVGTIALRVALHLMGSNADFTVLSIFVSFMVCVMSWIYGSSVGWYSHPTIFIKFLHFIALLPIVVILAIVSLPYFISFETDRSRFIAVAIAGELIIMWPALVLMRFRKRMIARDFIRNEFNISERAILTGYYQKIDLHAFDAQTDTGSWYLDEKLIHYSPAFLPIAYVPYFFGPINDESFAMYSLMIVAFPTLLYFTGRIVCGFYLWGYLAVQLQRKHGKPIHFRDFLDR